MQTIIFNYNDKNLVNEEVCICLGYFDGLHLGHLRLINKAKESKYKSCVLTFDFSNNINLKNKNVITSIEDKQRILSKIGIDYLLVLKFDNNIMNLSPNEFITFLLNNFNIKEVVIGEDFSFGKDAKGNKLTLLKYNFKVDVVEELKYENLKIGTSYIIKLLKEGNMILANKLLGYPYQISGVVNNGFHFGKNHDYPTANIDFNNYVVPKYGVYACKVLLDNKEYKAICNVGVHPTINELNKPILEVNLFNFDENLYNKKISIQLIDFIRDEKKFTSTSELYKQINLDFQTCLDILNH